MTEDRPKKLDSHSKSLSEAFINTFGGYPVGFLVGIAVLPSTAVWIQEDPITANAAITVVFSAASFVRLYVLRRAFDRLGYDDNIIRLAIRLGKKIRGR